MSEFSQLAAEDADSCEVGCELTVFTKTKMRETAEVERAKQAMARCQREGHTVSEDEEG